MAEIIITSYFAKSGIPEIGLTPTIRIWEVDSADHTLIIGSTQGTGDPGPVGGGIGAGSGVGTDGIMKEIFDNDNIAGSGGGAPAGSRDGFYQYTFDTANGYDASKCYVFRVDGGVTQTDPERYQVGELSTMNSAEALVDLIYDEPAIDHTTVGTMGALLNDLDTNVDNLVLGVADVLALVELSVKYAANRTEIDPVNATLTIYDIDCVTPLRTFQMLDGTGAPSIANVCERVPIATGTTDGQPVCP